MQKAVASLGSCTMLDTAQPTMASTPAGITYTMRHHQHSLTTLVEPS